MNCFYKPKPNQTKACQKKKETTTLLKCWFKKYIKNKTTNRGEKNVLTFVQCGVLGVCDFENALCHMTSCRKLAQRQFDIVDLWQFRRTCFCPCLRSGDSRRATNWRLLRTCRDPVCFGGKQNNDIWWWGCTACCPFKLLQKSAMETDYFYICYFPHLIGSVIEEEAAKAFREIQRVTFKVYIKTSGLLFREDWWAIECLNRCTGYLYDSAHTNLWLLSLHSKGV